MRHSISRFRFLFLLGCLGGVALPARAACPYFRSSVKLLSCAAPDPKAKKAQDPYPEAPSDIPELDQPSNKPLAHVTCSCSYSLSGSDPRCDVDQTVERSLTTGVESVSRYCRRGDSVCREVCAERLP